MPVIIKGEEWSYREDETGAWLSFKKNESSVTISVGVSEDALKEFISTLVKFLEDEAESRAKPLLLFSDYYGSHLEECVSALLSNGQQLIVEYTIYDRAPFNRRYKEVYWLERIKIDGTGPTSGIYLKEK